MSDRRPFLSILSLLPTSLRKIVIHISEDEFSLASRRNRKGTNSATERADNSAGLHDGRDDNRIRASERDYASSQGVSMSFASEGFFCRLLSSRTANKHHLRRFVS